MIVSRLRDSVSILFVAAALITTAQADMYVSAAGANSVMRFDEDGTFLGNFVQPGAGGLGDPQGIAFGPNGNLFVASNGSNNVLEFDGQDGTFIKVFAERDDWVWPAEINFRDGLLYVSDFRNNGTVTRFDALTGEFVDVFVDSLGAPDGQAWDNDGNIYVSEFGPNRVSTWDENGESAGNFILNNSGALNGPLDNLFLPDGTFLVSSFNNNRIKHYDAEGNYLGNITTLQGPQGLEIGPDGHLYMGSFSAGLINKYDINTFEFIEVAADAASTTNNFTFDVIPEPSLGLVGVLLSLWVAAKCVRGRK